MEVLTEEGDQMWKNIEDFELPPVAAKSKEVTRQDYYEMELTFLKKELRKMVQHSKNVIKDCDSIIEEYKDAQQYLAGDAKVAKTLHSRLIIRLEKLHNGQKVFDFEVLLPEDVFPQEEKSVLYYEPKRNN